MFTSRLQQPVAMATGQPLPPSFRERISARDAVAVAIFFFFPSFLSYIFKISRRHQLEAVSILIVLCRCLCGRNTGENENFLWL